ncbi:hypothetical protein [Roseomonas indoligenes]|uniref:Uncharacterized protein n=1 Tax=Roseomonas indoligenes TaxID=2820811 RepID=A0A940S7S1_9PROT|nr:hypothetical protein [Pararoseomonas indoligenes]MBP0495344.1 hypothetical protein [Pararoseomonas indoligenes]
MSVHEPSRLILDAEDRILRQRDIITRLERQGSDLVPTAQDLLRCMLETQRVFAEMRGREAPAGMVPAVSGAGQSIDAEALRQDLVRLAAHAASQDMRLAQEFFTMVQQRLLARLSG